MKPVFIVLITTLCSASAYAAHNDDIYWALKNVKEKTWCVYATEDSFKDDTERYGSTESARINFNAGHIATITYQISAESGDWISIDRYSKKKRTLSI